MKRAALFLLIASCLAGCNRSADGEDASVDANGVAATLGEEEASSPTDITPIDAASGFAGGMPEESAMPRVPRPEDSRRSARETEPGPAANATAPAATPSPTPAPTPPATGNVSG